MTAEELDAEFGRDFKRPPKRIGDEKLGKLFDRLEHLITKERVTLTSANASLRELERERSDITLTILEELIERNKE